MAVYIDVKIVTWRYVQTGISCLKSKRQLPYVAKTIYTWNPFSRDLLATHSQLNIKNGFKNILNVNLVICRFSMVVIQSFYIRCEIGAVFSGIPWIRQEGIDLLVFFNQHPLAWK